MISKTADWALRLLVVVVVVAIAGAPIVFERVKADEAALAVAASLLVLALLAVPLVTWGQWASKIRTARAFGLEVELAEQALEHASSAAADDEPADGDVDEVIDLQLRLEAKLAYLAKHVLARDARGYWSSFVTIGSLHEDGLLSRDDAIAARYLLALRPGDADASSPEARDRYLKKAKPFVGSIRATVFYRLVERVLRRDLKVGPRRLERGGNRRPDLHVRLERDGEVWRGSVFPAFANGSSFWNAERLRRRAEELASDTDWALLVVPPDSKAKLEPPVEGVRLVKLDRLVEAKRLEDVLVAEGLA